MIIRNFVAGLLLLAFSVSCGSDKHPGGSSNIVNPAKGNTTGSNIVELDTSNLDSTTGNTVKDSVR